MVPSQHIPRQHWTGSSTIRQRIWNLWPHNQCQGNQFDCPGCQPSPEINIGDHSLQVVDEFTFPGSTVSVNLSLHLEISRRIGNPQAPCPNRPREPGNRNIRIKTPKCTSFKHAYSSRYSTPEKLGLPTWDRNTVWTLSVCDASDASSVSSGNASSTVRYWHMLEPPVCTP